MSGADLLKYCVSTYMYICMHESLHLCVSVSINVMLILDMLELIDKNSRKRYLIAEMNN